MDSVNPEFVSSDSQNECTRTKNVFSSLTEVSTGMVALIQMGYFWSPLTHRVKILQKIKSATSQIMHHTSHIMHINLEVILNINDQNSCALKQLIKTNRKKVCKAFFYENYQIDNIIVKLPTAPAFQTP